MNKSLFRHNKFTQAVNIHDIFSKHHETNNPKIKQLQSELIKLRGSIRKQKEENRRNSLSLTDPLISANYQKYLEIEVKTKEKNQKVKQMEEERNMMKKQIELMKMGENEQFEIDYEADLKKAKDEASEVFNKIKEERSKIYELDKKDMVCT